MRMFRKKVKVNVGYQKKLKIWKLFLVILDNLIIKL